MILERLSVSMERITELFSLTISKGKLELMDNSSEMTRSLSRLFYHEVDYNHIFDENLSNNEKGTGLIESPHKVGCVFPMIIIPILPQAGFGLNDHRDHAPHFISLSLVAEKLSI